MRCADVEGMVIGQRDDAGAELDALRALGRRGEEHFRRSDDFPAGRVVLAAPELRRSRACRAARRSRGRGGTAASDARRSGDAGRGRLRISGEPWGFLRGFLALGFLAAPRLRAGGSQGNARACPQCMVAVRGLPARQNFALPPKVEMKLTASTSALPPTTRRRRWHSHRDRPAVRSHPTDPSRLQAAPPRSLWLDPKINQVYELRQSTIRLSRAVDRARWHRDTAADDRSGWQPHRWYRRECSESAAADLTQIRCRLACGPHPGLWDSRDAPKTRSSP